MAKVGRPMGKLHQDDVKRFYVYELFDERQIQYVGKGSGRRLSVQMKKFCLQGRVVAWFDKEADAYGFEIEHIAAARPALNICKGGNGSKATKSRPPKKCALLKLIDRIGSRAVAARLVLAYAPNTSKREELRGIAAYG